jgi:Lysozyme inhibitor LprI
MRTFTACALLLTSALSAAAQSAVRDQDRVTIDACLQREKTAPERCIGAMSGPCSEAPQTPADSAPPGSTAGRGFCTQREIAVWREKIDATLAALRTGPLGKTVANPWNRPPDNKRASPVPGTDIIDDMHRHWLIWRVKKCDTQAMQYEDGSLSRVVYATCLNDETARHALWLMTLEEN